MARRYIEYYRATDLDIMKVMNDTGYRPIGSFLVERARDWLRLEPTPLDDERFQKHLEGLKLIVDTLGEEVLIMTTAFNPYNQAAAIIRASSPERYGTFHDACRGLVEQAQEAPEAVIFGLRTISGDLARFYRACVTEAGIDRIYYSAQGGERARAFRCAPRRCHEETVEKQRICRGVGSPKGKFTNYD